MMFQRWKTIVMWTIVIFNLLALGFPTIIIIGASLTSGDIVTFPPKGLSFRWYGELWQMDDFKDAFLRSAYVSVICTVLSIPDRTLAAISLVRAKIKFRNMIQVYLL